MKRLVIKDNPKHLEPDLFVNGIDIYKQLHVTKVSLSILPDKPPKLTIEADLFDEIDIKAALGDIDINVRSIE